MKHRVKVGDRVKVQGDSKRHCCYGMVGTISFIRPGDKDYGPSACVVFNPEQNEFGEAKDYHWCDPKSLVLTDEPSTIMADPLDRIRGLFKNV